MIFSRVVISLLSFGSISAVLATPTPVPVTDEKRTIEKRADVSDVLSAVTTLQSATSSILPQINSLVSAATATADNVTPLLQQLQQALNTAGTSITSLESGFDASTGGSAQDVANAIAPVISDILNSLNGLQTLDSSVFGPLITSLGLDAALNTILSGLSVLLAGVLELVAALLGDVGSLLSNLGFTLTGLALGLLGIL